MKLVKSETEPIIATFFILQFAKLRMLELYYNSFDKYCDATKFEDLEMDTVSLYLALSEQDLYDCIRPAMKKVRNSLRNVDGTNFQPTQQQIFSLVPACAFRTMLRQA